MAGLVFVSLLWLVLLIILVMGIRFIAKFARRNGRKMAIRISIPMALVWLWGLDILSFWTPIWVRALTK